MQPTKIKRSKSSASTSKKVSATPTEVKKEAEEKSGRKKKSDEPEKEVWKWWEEAKADDGTKWKFLQHLGNFADRLFQVAVSKCELDEKIDSYYLGAYLGGTRKVFNLKIGLRVVLAASVGLR